MKGNRTQEAPRLAGIIWPFIAVVVFQVLLGSLSLYALSAVRAYVAGESLWSKAQKDAIYYLNLYADDRDERTYQRYRQVMTVPQGDHELRELLDQASPDLEGARQAVLQGATTRTMSTGSSGSTVISARSATCRRRSITGTSAMIT